jgi:hypothetical protein
MLLYQVFNKGLNWPLIPVGWRKQLWNIRWIFWAFREQWVCTIVVIVSFTSKLTLFLLPNKILLLSTKLCFVPAAYEKSGLGFWCHTGIIRLQYDIFLFCVFLGFDKGDWDENYRFKLC